MRSVAGKKQILDALDGLPDDATLEDAMERLYFLTKIEKGLGELDAGKGVEHDEVKRRYGL
jgi:predicted transcriptional regulator